MASRVSIDIETLSECDLRKTGTHVYAQHQSTMVTVVAYAIDDAPVKIWRVATDPCIPDELLAACLDRNVTFHAWNAGGFEMLVLPEKCPNWPLISPSRWRCTMIRAAYWGLPMKLDSAAKALNTNYQKDMDGHRLMLTMSKPRKHGSYWHIDEPERYNKLCDYCAQDVEVERDIAAHLPDLPEAEQRLWELDFEMMSRGMPIDKKAIRALQVIAENEVTRLDTDMRYISQKKVPSTRSMDALLRHCYKRFDDLSIPPDIQKKILPSLDRETIDAYLDNCGPAPLYEHKTLKLSLPEDVARMLRVRKEAAKSSVAKLQAMENCATSDARIHGLTQFYGASRTGRYAGRLVQVQNLPRGVKGVDAKEEMQSLLQQSITYMPPPTATTLEVISSCLRGCFKPEKGKFYVGDFSQIEARVVAWLAGQDDILDVFADPSRDVYVYTANKLGSQDRQFGKVLVLACGFGMGATKFKDTAATYGLDLSEQDAKNAVTRWRESSPHIVAFWRNLENAARKVLDGKTNTPDGVMNVGKIRLAMGKRKLRGCLLIGLPSGRHLCYRNACTVASNPGFPPSIVYDGQNQITRKWERQTTYGGKLCENIVQAVAACLLRNVLSSFPVSMVPLVTVHDEVICVARRPEAHNDEYYVTALKRLMETPPSWAKGLPMGADVKAMERYGK